MKQSRKFNVVTEIESTGIYVKVGSDMKRRVRTLVRAGWTLVEVPAIAPSGFSIQTGRFHEDENPAHFRTLYKWCSDNVPLTDWTASFIQNSGTSNQGGTKRFVFKDAKFASWFTLMNT